MANDYVFTGSSNSATEGEPLNIEIKISCPPGDDPAKKIKLVGIFTLENLEKIATDENLKNLRCTLYGKTDDTNLTGTSPDPIGEMVFIKEDPDKRSIRIPGDDSREYTYMMIKLSNAICTMPDMKATLSITFKDINKDGKAKQVLAFEINKEEAKPEIISFSSDHTVVQIGGLYKKFRLSWKVNGSNYTYKLSEDLKPLLPPANAKGETLGFKVIPDPQYVPGLEAGNYTYTLEVTQGDISVTKSVMVRVLNKSEISPGANLQSPYAIINFCVSNDGSAIFSLVNNTDDNGISSIDSIGFSTEGFSGQWTIIALSDNDKQALHSFAFSFMIHLKYPGQVLGKLIFIGGSHVDQTDYKNSVAIVDLDQDGDDKVRIYDDMDWPSRMGHYCVLFPHEGTDKIWLIGGQDSGGATLNDIWVSADGFNWKQIFDTSPVPWSPRCLLGAAVNLDDNGVKNELWIGGGFSETDGKPTPDIWKWDQAKWSRVSIDTATPFPIMENNDSSYYLSSALAFIGRKTANATGMYAFGGNVSGTNTDFYFDRITISNIYFRRTTLKNISPLRQLDTTGQAHIITCFFKGCLWYLVLNKQGADGVAFSSLFFWVPEIGPQTMIL